MTSKRGPLNFLWKIEPVVRLLAETEGRGVKLQRRPNTFVNERQGLKPIPTYLFSKIINKILRVFNNINFQRSQPLYVGLRSRKERSLGLDERFERLQSTIS